MPRTDNMGMELIQTQDFAGGVWRMLRYRGDPAIPPEEAAGDSAFADLSWHFQLPFRPPFSLPAW